MVYFCSTRWQCGVFLFFNANTVPSNDTSKGKSLFLEEAYSNNSSGLKRFQFKALVKRKNVALNVEEEQKKQTLQMWVKK